MAPKALTSVLSRFRAARVPSGASGEALACRHLESLGWQIVARNFRCRSGELDVVARDGAVTVFVEVKQRQSASHGEGHEAVTFGKRRRVIRAARLFASAHGLGDSGLRFDVISIDPDPSGKARIRHDRGAFDADGV